MYEYWKNRIDRIKQMTDTEEAHIAWDALLLDRLKWNNDLEFFEAVKDMPDDCGFWYA